MSKRDSFDKFAERINVAADKIDLKRAIDSQREGKAGLRDRIVSSRMAWQEAMVFLGLLQTMIIFLGLMPFAISNINSGIEVFASFFGITDAIQFPIELASVAAFIFICFMFVFGVIAIRYLGTMKRSVEISTLMNAGMLSLNDQIDDMKDEILLEVKKMFVELENENKSV